jgi:deoxyribonuclease-4
MAVKFGPAGIGPIKDVEETFKTYNSLGIRVAEIPFTYGVYIKKNKHKKEIQDIKKFSHKFGIELSVHAPYWINLNSKEKEKTNASKKRILDSCEIASLFSHNEKTRVVFHCGYYGGSEPKTKQIAFENIKKRILEMLEYIKKRKYNVELCPEVMGKKNVFGSIEEISKISKETGCGFCIDFAHVLARYGENKFELLKKNFPQKKWHCHFSGIEYGEKGEKHHKLTGEKEWKNLLKNLPKNKEIVIINESPDPVGDSFLGVRVLKTF